MKNFKSFFKRRFLKFKFSKDYLLYKKPNSLEELFDLNNMEIYMSMFYYFHKYLSKDIKKLRGYFNSNFRGFGEDAFFSIWYFIFKSKIPTNILEIGVYRGQSLALFQLLSDKNNIPSNIFGISPFTNIGDEYSEYPDIDYIYDIQNSFEKFKLKKPNLIEGLSQDENITNFIKSQMWDLIYVDGSHDYEVVIDDLRISADYLNKGGILAVDDSNKDSDFDSEYIEKKFKIRSSDGHNGPTIALADLLEERNDIKKLLSVGHINFLIKLT